MPAAQLPVQAGPSRATRRAPYRPPAPGVKRARALLLVLTLVGTGIMVALFCLSVVAWTPLAFLALFLVCVSGAWISGGAATALIGALLPQSEPLQPPSHWVPAQKTALLMTMCGEDSQSAAHYLTGLHASLLRAGLHENVRLVVLSDTSDPKRAAREDANFAAMIERGVLTYRRRAFNHRRKPGNIADWVQKSSAMFDHMLVLDADSRMSVARIKAMIWHMEQQPKLGLLQAGIALLPGRSRFGRHQRLSARLLSPNFLRGFTAWTGSTGNYWGHNAIIRLAAFRAALDLPVLRGQAPFGGEILSHDFVEAAWMRRAGWLIQVDGSLAGSCEDAPQTLQEFSKRDRRWCQGNMQHTRLLAEPGLHLLSRFHLLLGIVSYLAAPIWLMLLVLLTSGAVELSGAMPLFVVAGLLLAPKLCALPQRLAIARTPRRRWRFGGAFLTELATAAILAPIIMVRQTGAVLAVLLGRDCGWKNTSARRLALPFTLPPGMAELAVSIGLAGIALGSGTGLAFWLAPVIAPLFFAPLIIKYMDAAP